MRQTACALLVAAAACTDQPARVFVPGATYTESIRVWTDQGDSATVPIGQYLILHGERDAGPWIEVDRRSLDADACWWTSAIGFEEEVAGSLKWTAEPAGPAEFNTDLRLDQSRAVRFTQPGIYTLTPESSGWCSDPYLGNVLHVVVTLR